MWEGAIDETGGDAPAARPQARMPGRGQLASSRLPPAGEPKLRFSAPNRPPSQSPETDQQEGDDHLGGGVLDAGLDVAARARATHARPRPPGAAEARARGEAYRSPGDRHRQVMVRRAATGATAAVAVVAVVVAVIFLSTGGKNPGKVTTTTTHRGGGGSSTTTSTTTTTTLPTSLKPISVSTSNVAFNVPSGSYTLTFQATSGACWVGIEHTGAGPWLFSQTLDAGQSATYKAAGALVMTLGAPRYIALSVNGLVADLPAGINQPYNVELTPSAG